MEQQTTLQDIAELADKDKPYPVELKFKIDPGVWAGIAVTMIVATILYFIRK
jgi:hypothetical protein